MRINGTEASPEMVGFLRKGRLRDFVAMLLQSHPEGVGVEVEFADEAEEVELLQHAQREEGTSLFQAMKEDLELRGKELRFGPKYHNRVFTTVALEGA